MTMCCTAGTQVWPTLFTSLPQLGHKIQRVCMGYLHIVGRTAHSSGLIDVHQVSIDNEWWTAGVGGMLSICLVANKGYIIKYFWIVLEFGQEYYYSSSRSTVSTSSLGGT